MKFHVLFPLLLCWSGAFSQTSVYLSSNKDIYIAGEDLWYNAFILDQETLTLSELDKILYLQLAKNDTTVWKEMYPVMHGVSAGHVYLPATLPEGNYLLKAYTAHSFFKDQANFYAIAPVQIVHNARHIKHYRLPETTTPDGKRLRIQLTPSKQTYAPHEEVILKITTTDNAGHPIPAAVSISVYDRLFNNPVYERDIADYFNRKITGQPFLPDSIPAIINKKGQQSLLLFNYNKTISQFTTTDNTGTFYLSPDHLSISPRFFIRYFSEKEQTIRITDPWDSILALHPKDMLTARELPPDTITTNALQYGQLLKEVVIASKGRVYPDPFLGYLDSLAKFEDNYDYVGQCGWLNCPFCTSKGKPVEGTVYTQLKASKRSQVSGHPFSFGADDIITQPYHYPKYTPEELLKNYKMVITKGFWQHAPFYAAANSNALYWNPVIVTDEHGEATVRFYTSAIKSGFLAAAAGVSGSGGWVGAGSTSFEVE